MSYSDNDDAFEFIQADKCWDHKAATPHARAFTTCSGELHHTNSSMPSEPFVLVDSRPPAPQPQLSPYSPSTDRENCQLFENNVMTEYGKKEVEHPNLTSSAGTSVDNTPASTRESTPTSIGPVQQRPETEPASLKIDRLTICDVAGAKTAPEVLTSTATGPNAIVGPLPDGGDSTVTNNRKLDNKTENTDTPTGAKFNFADSSLPLPFSPAPDQKSNIPTPPTTRTGRISDGAHLHLEAYILRPHAGTLAHSVTWTYITELLHLTSSGIQAHVVKLGSEYSIIDAVSELLPEQFRLVQDRTKARNGQLLAVQYGAAVDMVTHMGTFQMRPVVFVIKTKLMPYGEGNDSLEKTAGLTMEPQRPQHISLEDKQCLRQNTFSVYMLDRSGRTINTGAEADTGERDADTGEAQHAANRPRPVSEHDRLRRVFAKPIGLFQRNPATEPNAASSEPAMTFSSVHNCGFSNEDPSFREGTDISGSARIQYNTITSSFRHTKRDVSLEQIRMADYGAGRTDVAYALSQEKISYPWEDEHRTDHKPAPKYNYSAPGVQHCCWLPASATTPTTGLSGKSPVEPNKSLFVTPSTPTSGHGLFGGGGKSIFGVPNTTQSGGSLFGANPPPPSTGLFDGISPASSGKVFGERRTSSTFGDGIFTGPFAAPTQPHSTKGASESTSTAPNLFTHPATSKTTSANDPSLKCRKCSISLIFRSENEQNAALCNGCKRQSNIREGLEERWPELYKKQEADRVAAQSSENTDKLPLPTKPSTLFPFLGSTPTGNETGFKPIKTGSGSQGSFLNQFASKI